MNYEELLVKQVAKRGKRITELQAQLKAVLEDNTKLAQIRQEHNLRQQAKGLKFALDNITDPEIIYNKHKSLTKQADELEGE